MKCIQCGKEIDDDLKFCPYCGTKQTRTESSVKQLNEGPNVNYHKEDNSRLNQYLTKISSGKMTAISGIINGIFILVMVYIVSKLKHLEGLEELYKTLKPLPGVYYCSLFFAIVTCLISIINVVHHKDLKTLILAVLSGIETLLLAANLRIISLLNNIVSFNLNGLSNYSSYDTLNDLDNPSKLIGYFRMSIGFGIFVLIFSIVLLVIFMKRSQEVYNQISIDSLKEFYPKNLISSVNSLQNNQVKKISKKQKMIGAIVIALIVAVFGGYNIWDNFFNYTKIDLTKHLKVTFDGRSGDGSVVFKENPVEYDKSDAQITDFVDDVDYHYSKDSGLKNGDTITVTAVYNKENAKKLKLKVVNVSKKFKVSHLIYRFSNAKQVSQKIVSTIKKVGLDEVDERANSDEHDRDFTLNGVYFIKGDESDSLVVVYKGVAASQDDYLSPVCYYYYEINDIDSAYLNIDSDYQDETSILYKENGDEVTNDAEVSSALQQPYGVNTSVVVEKVE